LDVAPYVSGIRDLARGQYERRLHAKSSDALIEIAQAFNELAGKLDDANNMKTSSATQHVNVKTPSAVNNLSLAHSHHPELGQVEKVEGTGDENNESVPPSVEQKEASLPPQELDEAAKLAETIIPEESAPTFDPPKPQDVRVLFDHFVSAMDEKQREGVEYDQFQKNNHPSSQRS